MSKPFANGGRAVLVLASVAVVFTALATTVRAESALAQACMEGTTL